MVLSVFSSFVSSLRHCRCHFADAQIVTGEPVIDSAADLLVAHFVEATSTRTKTSRKKSGICLHIPLVGLANGVSGLPWAVEWLACRIRMSLKGALLMLRYVQIVFVWEQSRLRGVRPNELRRPHTIIGNCKDILDVCQGFLDFRQHVRA
eukprot:529864-Amphidinium_carterae.1